MKEINTIENYISTVRGLYMSENEPIVKGYWLKIGVIMKKMLDEEKYMPFDEADQRFKDEVFERLNSS